MKALAEFEERIKQYEEQIKKLDKFDKTHGERRGSRGKRNH
jgi:hypothetical protein